MAQWCKLKADMEKRQKLKSTARTLQAERTHITTGINLPADIWELLHKVSFERAKNYGGRPSVSALLVELVQKHRKELEKELTG
jgi:hypothetical protein